MALSLIALLSAEGVLPVLQADMDIVKTMEKTKVNFLMNLLNIKPPLFKCVAKQGTIIHAEVVRNQRL